MKRKCSGVFIPCFAFGFGAGLEHMDLDLDWWSIGVQVRTVEYIRSCKQLHLEWFLADLIDHLAERGQERG